MHLKINPIPFKKLFTKEIVAESSALHKIHLMHTITFLGPEILVHPLKKQLDEMIYYQ
jgi:hypothetical protein